MEKPEKSTRLLPPPASGVTIRQTVSEFAWQPEDLRYQPIWSALDSHEITRFTLSIDNQENKC